MGDDVLLTKYQDLQIAIVISIIRHRLDDFLNFSRQLLLHDAQQRRDQDAG